MRGTCLKHYEIESFFKSFIIFLIVLEILLAINFWYEYQNDIQSLEKKIYSEMQICAYTTKCKEFDIDFVDPKDNEKNILYKNMNFYAYFDVPTTNEFVMKVLYTYDKYWERIEILKQQIYRKFLLYSSVSVLIALLYSLYALKPLRQALRLNEEFIKDILHDFNTPISSMMINLKILKKEIKNNNKIERLEHNIQTILALQDNLQAFIKNSPVQASKFSLKSLIDSRIKYFKLLYPDLTYKQEIKGTMLYTNQEAFIRILDNLINNACKYNKKEGMLSIYMQDNVLYIEDTGKGIENISKVFNRYYKEQDRGIGIGLNIVKKLCAELHILLKIKSVKNKGTIVALNLTSILG